MCSSCCRSRSRSPFLEKFEVILDVCQLLFDNPQAALFFVDDAESAQENVFFIRRVQRNTRTQLLRIGRTISEGLKGLKTQNN